MKPLQANSICSSIIALLVVTSAWFAFPAQTSPVRAQSAPIATMFSLPLGYADGVRYGPRINYRGSTLIEDSEYGVFNPDMQGSTCFGIDWGKIYHAGEDWYRMDGATTFQAVVTAVADGQVRYMVHNFPGTVMLIEHSLPPDGSQKIYSLYGHMDPNSISVSVNQVVTRGQRLGTVMRQYFDGRYTEYHDDLHLHFEMRYFYDASNIYKNYPNCNGYLPGRGYTYPQHPDNFPPQLSTHYTDPIDFVKGHVGVYLPFVIKQELTCIDGQQLLLNGGFESPNLGWTEKRQANYPIITDGNLPTPAYDGDWVAWFGGRNNAKERIYQDFKVYAGTSSAELTYYLWMGTQETSLEAFDTLSVQLTDNEDNFIAQLDFSDDNGTTDTWLSRTISLPDLTPYAGRWLRLNFEGLTDESLVTSFLVDNVSLAAVCNGVPLEQPSAVVVTPVGSPGSNPASGALEKPVIGDPEESPAESPQDEPPR